MLTDFLLIAGMAAVTYFSRVLPMVLLSSRTMPEPLLRFLGMVPPAVLAALLAPSLLLHNTAGELSFFLSPENAFLLASGPTLIVGWLTSSFFGTVITGMALVALLRFYLA